MEEHTATSSSINFDTEERPFVITADDNPLAAWPCAHWTLAEWAEQYAQVRFKFRVHPRKQRPDASIHWENEAVSSVDATVAHLLAHVRERDTAGTAATSESTDANPFEVFPTEDYCFYSAYNYMHELSESKPDLLYTVRWRDTAGGLLLGSEQVNDAKKSTLWMGTSGAYTPCHMDTYGYNFVAQLQGRKRWILFPPADTAHLYPVRIPFEESSIFSQVNFKCIDLLQFPLLRHTTPHVVELKAGEVLFVPRHWWHFVENVDDDDQENGDHGQLQTVSISINMWVTGDEHESSVSEGLVQFLARPLLEAYGDSSWLNLGADLLDAPKAGHILKALLNVKQIEDKESDEVPEKETKRPRTLLNRLFLSSCKLEDIGVEMKNTNSGGEPSPGQQFQKQIDLKDIVNCILDPEVIDLIKSKLRRCAKAASLQK